MIYLCALALLSNTAAIAQDANSVARLARVSGSGPLVTLRLTPLT